MFAFLKFDQLKNIWITTYLGLAIVFSLAWAGDSFWPFGGVARSMIRPSLVGNLLVAWVWHWMRFSAQQIKVRKEWFAGKVNMGASQELKWSIEPTLIVSLFEGDVGTSLALFNCWLVKTGGDSQALSQCCRCLIGAWSYLHLHKLFC